MEWSSSAGKQKPAAHGAEGNNARREAMREEALAAREEAAAHLVDGEEKSDGMGRGVGDRPLLCVCCVVSVGGLG